MRQIEAPAGYNEAPCSSTLPHQVSLCFSAQHACVCTALRLATKPHVHKHIQTYNLPLPALPAFLNFSCLCLICFHGIFLLFLLCVFTLLKAPTHCP